MARRTLSLPVDKVSVRGDKHDSGSSTIADRLFPGVRNPTGHLLDLLSQRQGK